MRKKVIVYGSQECEPCQELKKKLDSEGIKYGFVDVLGGLGHLKKYLNVRDANPALYETVMAEGRVGIPTVVIDDTEVYLDTSKIDFESLK